MQRIQLIIIGLVVYVSVLFAQDTTINRSVTIERDFQPVVQAAGKIEQVPEAVVEEVRSATLRYSDYTAAISPVFNANALQSSPDTFPTPDIYHGHIRAGLGHSNTLLDFGYQLADKRQNYLNIYAQHKGSWGSSTHSRSLAGMDFSHLFQNCVFRFGVRGEHTFYTHDGRYFDGNRGLTIDRYSALLAEDKQTIWDVDAYLGVDSRANADLQYKVEVAYQLFSLPPYAKEHQVRTTGRIDWRSDRHHVGGNIYLQNAFIQTDSVASSLYNPRHALRMEPYYAYKGDRFSLHAGINFDMNIGRGQFLSYSDNVTFAPSPNISFEGEIAPKWLILYGEAKGRHSAGTIDGGMYAIPYRHIPPLITSHHAAAYTPIDAMLGFRIKAYRDLLIDLHGGYAYQLHQTTTVATLAPTRENGMSIVPGTFAYFYSNYGKGKIGADIHYHYQDIIQLRLGGNYYFWEAFLHEDAQQTIENGLYVTTLKKDGYEQVHIRPDGVYDRASWDAYLDIDARINKHWSLYSHNRFVGSRTALVSVPDALGSYERILAPTVDLSLGVQYETIVGKKSVKRNLKEPNFVVFFSLDNYLHQPNMAWYGYLSNGIQFTVGVSYRF